MDNNFIPIPTYLEVPPSTEVSPPVEPKKQELPFSELAWEDFEKLCLRLVRLEADVEHCQVYGKKGQKQEGIDLYARMKSSEKYYVYQCKRVKDFDAGKIKEAVKKLLDGNWVDKTEVFILCTSEKMDSTDRAEEIEAQNEELKKRNITLLSWDGNELNSKLKKLPEIVDDFFGREWVKAFNGEKVVEKFGEKLDAIEIANYRKEFAKFYDYVFNAHDTGLPLPAKDKEVPLPIDKRYIIPDIYEGRSIHIAQTEEEHSSQTIEKEFYKNDFHNISSTKQRKSREKDSSITYKNRLSVEKWLSMNNRNIVLGEPGIGKSTLLRFIIIDLLKKEPLLNLLSSKWGLYLPVWVPFALWTVDCQVKLTPLIT